MNPRGYPQPREFGMLYCLNKWTTLPEVMPPIEPSSVRPHKALLDRMGATGSMLCAIHCAALPLVLAIAPAIGATFANPVFEVGFIAFASILGMTSLLLGYLQHRVMRALIFLVPGIALLWTAVLIDTLHQSLIAHAVAMASGGTLVATAHVINLRLSHRHRGHHDECGNAIAAESKESRRLCDLPGDHADCCGVRSV